MNQILYVEQWKIKLLGERIKSQSKQKRIEECTRLIFENKKKQKKNMKTNRVCKENELKMKTHKNSKHIGNYSTPIYYKNRANSVYFLFCSY